MSAWAATLIGVSGNPHKDPPFTDKTLPKPIRMRKPIAVAVVVERGRAGVRRVRKQTSPGHPIRKFKKRSDPTNKNPNVAIIFTSETERDARTTYRHFIEAFPASSKEVHRKLNAHVDARVGPIFYIVNTRFDERGYQYPRSLTLPMD